jgi:hypothetical protein
MRRGARGRRKTAAAEGEARFEHSSHHDDLKALVEDHLLDADDAAVTAKWYPSRRGNSPRSAGGRASKSTP